MPLPVERPRFTRFPVVSLAAEYLVMGHLLRRNVLAYKAPPNNEGYDLICIHPNPRKKSTAIRVQVKSRLATDCDRGFPVSVKSFRAFDYVTVVFLNAGYYHRLAEKNTCRAGSREPEFYTFPLWFIKKYHVTSGSWEKVRTGGLHIEEYKNEKGFEQIARALHVPYPEKKRSRDPDE
jgi:hypothetical protein